MPLQKQPMELLFGKGIDTKSDPKTLEIGNLSILENGVLKKKNRIDKRNGYNQIGKTIIGGAASPSVDNTATFKDELLLYANQNLYSYSKSTDQLADKGPCVSSIVTTDQIVKNAYSQFQTDSAELNGVAVFAYEDTRSGIRATVTDSATGLAILSDVSIDPSATATRVRVLAFQNYIHVFYYKAGIIYVRRISTSSPSAFDAAVATTTNVNTTTPNYDVLNYGEARILIATNYQTSAGIKMTFIDVAGTVYTATYPAVVVGTEAGFACVSLILGDLNKIYLVYQTATPLLRCVILNAGLTVLRSAFTLNATASLVVNVTGYVRNDATGIDVIYDFANADTTKFVVRKVTALASGSASGDAVLLRSVAVSSKAFKYGDYYFFGVVHDSPLQATFFLVRNDGLIIAKQKYGVAGGVSLYSNMLPVVSKISDAKFRYSFCTQGTLIDLGGGFFTTLGGVCQTEIDFSAADVFTSAELGNNLLICGGTLQNYDGQSVTEHGFHLFPEGVTATTSAAGGLITAGTYNYIVVYEWTDNVGQLHRSAPSISISQTTTGSTSSNTVIIPTLRLTAKKEPTRTPVSLAVYRTENAGTLYYRVSSLLTPTLNDPTVATDIVNFVDTLADTAIISKELLYTTGNVLENFSPGSCSSITTFKNRVFLAGLENKNQVIYSKAVTSGVPVQFAQEFTLLTDDKGPRITALSKLNDKVIIFKKNSFNITYGDGPDDTGVNGSFAQPEFVSSDVGCLDSQSIAQIQGAITFKSDNGLYLLNSQLQTQYFGSPVEDYNSLTVTSAVVKPDVNQIRFTTSDGVCLVFDYFFQQWSTFTNHAGKDAVVWNGSYVYVRSTGEVLIESEGFYKDIAAPYHLKVATSFIALAGVNGFQRVYRFGLLGEYKTPHLLSIKAGYDFSSALETVMIFDPVTAMGIDTFGDGGAFGSDSPFGGANISYRVRGHLPRQKCQSIKFVLEELTTAASEGTGEALTVSGLTLIVGVKSGLTKLKSSQSLG
jgi:hypothetical protein